MKVALQCMAALLVMGLVVEHAAAEPKTDPRERLETAIPEAIRLIEAKELVALVKNFVAPEDLKKITRDSTIEEVAKKFEGKKADRLREALLAAKEVEPTFDETGTTATYRFKMPVDGRTTITFTKVGKLWYIRN